MSIISGFTTCNVHFLRITNVIALTSIMMLAWKCRALIIRAGVRNRRDQIPRLRSADSLHTAVNIALFPPLFFFSGLYYTDVLSTGVVLYLYKLFLEQGERDRNCTWKHELRERKNVRTWKDGAWFYVCGVLALCMRQTNIFWAAIFLGGMEAVRTMKETNHLPAPSFESPKVPTSGELKSYYELAKSEQPHDPPLYAACLEGKHFLHLISLATIRFLLPI